MYSLVTGTFGFEVKSTGTLHNSTAAYLLWKVLLELYVIHTCRWSRNWARGGRFLVYVWKGRLCAVSYKVEVWHSSCNSRWVFLSPSFHTDTRIPLEHWVDLAMYVSIKYASANQVRSWCLWMCCPGPGWEASFGGSQQKYIASECHGGKYKTSGTDGKDLSSLGGSSTDRAHFSNTPKSSTLCRNYEPCSSDNLFNEPHPQLSRWGENWGESQTYWVISLQAMNLKVFWR